MSYQTTKQYNRARKYWVIVFATNTDALKYRFESKSFRSFYYWLQRNGIDWTAINVYHRLPNSQRGAFVVQLNPRNYYNQIQYL